MIAVLLAGAAALTFAGVVDDRDWLLVAALGAACLAVGMAL